MSQELQELQELWFEKKQLNCVLGCLTVKNEPYHPCPEVVPVSIGNCMYFLIIGGTVVFNWDRWVEMANPPKIYTRSL